MKIKEYMKRDVISVPTGTSIGNAAALIVGKHIGTLPVVDASGIPVGVVSLKDLLSLEMPDFINLVEDFDFVHDFGAVETTRPTFEQLSQPVTAIMQPVVTVEQESGLLRAYALMLQNDLYDLPVTGSSEKLTGIVSLVDIGSAILSLWKKE